MCVYCLYYIYIVYLGLIVVNRNKMYGIHGVMEEIVTGCVRGVDLVSGDI